MTRALCILLVPFVFSSLAGCASQQPLLSRLDLMEKEIADLHLANRKINQRMDELQIQLSLIDKKLSRRGAQGRPKLKVVKLKPGKTTKKTKTQIKCPNRQGSMKEIDPRKVSERLPVDNRAARRTLWGLEPNQ
jgi:hypothetical protein